MITSKPGSNTAKKIVYAITKGNWGGAQRYVFDLATNAVTQGYDVLVVYGVHGRLIEELQTAGIRTERLSDTGREVKISSDWSALKSLVSLLKRERPDVLHVNSSKIGGIGALAGRIVGIKNIIFTAHGWAFNEKRPVWQRSLIWLSHYSTVLLCHKVIAVSFAVQNDAHHMPFVQQKFYCIHNGIENVHPVLKADAQKKLIPEISHPATWIGTIAELHPTKNIDVLIRAFAKILYSVNSEKERILVLIGDGEKRAELEALASTLKISDRVYFLGHVADASKYLEALDIFALPSHSEALAYVLLEAGMATLPVVATRVGGIPEVIVDQETGLLVPPDEVVPLADAITSLLENPERGALLAKNLHEKVVAEFSEKDMVEKTFALY